MKILAYTPTAPRLEAEVVDSLFHQTVSDFDIMIGRDNPFPVGINHGMHRNIALTYEKARTIVLTNDYDKLWIVECDTIPPVDALEKLRSVVAPVVTGVYALRHKVMPNYNYPEGGWVDLQINWGRPFKVNGGCLGCLLIDKTVLAKIHFRFDVAVGTDTMFAEDCVKAGVLQMAHGGVVCGHKRPNGEVLWPQQDGTVRTVLAHHHYHDTRCGRPGCRICKAA